MTLNPQLAAAAGITGGGIVEGNILGHSPSPLQRKAEKAPKMEGRALALHRGQPNVPVTPYAHSVEIALSLQGKAG